MIENVKKGKEYNYNGEYLKENIKMVNFLMVFYIIQNLGKYVEN